VVRRHGRREAEVKRRESRGQAVRAMRWQTRGAMPRQDEYRRQATQQRRPEKEEAAGEEKRSGEKQQPCYVRKRLLAQAYRRTKREG